MEIITHSASETQKFGREIAAQLKGGEVLALTGDLGSGKTTFVQGLAEGLGVSTRIISPTFILMRKYEAGKFKFYHLDLYRFEENIEAEVENLGAPNIWNQPENIMVIEWAEKIKNITPQSAVWIKFESLGPDERKITVGRRL